MKKTILVLLLSCLPYFAHGEAPAGIPVYPDFESAKKRCLDVLSKSDETLDKIATDLTPEITTKLGAEADKYDAYMKMGGTIAYCECLKTLTLGSRIKKCGFLIKLQKNGAAFFEIKFYRDTTGWEIIGWHVSCNTGTADLMDAVPAEYWNVE